MSEPSRRQFLALGTAALLTGCARPHAAGPVGRPAPQPVDGSASLKAHATAKGFLTGAAVAVQALGQDAPYASLIREQSSIVVAENAMKWAPLRPAFDRFEFEAADRLVAFAEENRIKIRGHNLCWHRQLPGWFAGYATPANAAELLRVHIETVAGRYSARMHSWDVVNEAVHVPDGRADGLRESPWLKLVGPDYIEQAFRAARAADPQALLTYNDYGIEGEDEGARRKRAAVLVLLRRLKTRGVPVDALGIQGHIQAGGTYGAGLAEFMAACRGMNLQIFITEMDVNDRRISADIATRDAAVAATYASFLALVLREPAVRAVLTWGITDRRTWLNGEDAREDHLPERCLPFGLVDGVPDQPKAAFFAMRNSYDARVIS